MKRGSLFLFLLRFISWCVALLPWRALSFLGWLLGVIWFYLVPIRRGWTLGHLSLYTDSPKLRWLLARRVYIQTARNVVELVGAARLRRDPALFSVEGLEHLSAAREGGRGVLVLSAHLGAYDLALCHEGLKGRQSLILSKRLHSSNTLSRWWMEQRARFGVEIACGGGATKAALSHLRKGGVVAMVMDQHSPERGAVESPFFGEMARTSPAFATLAVRTGAPVVPCYIEQRGRGYLIRYGAALPVPKGEKVRDRIESLTVSSLASVEEAIRSAPGQWLWLHRRWKDREGNPLVGRRSILSRWLGC